MIRRCLTELLLFHRRYNLLDSFKNPSLPGHRSNEDINRPTSHKDTNPSSIPLRYNIFREPLATSLNRSYIIVRSASSSCLLSARLRCIGDLLFIFFTIHPDWTVSLQSHFRLIFTTFVYYNLNH